jgi:hypothetical protein
MKDLISGRTRLKIKGFTKLIKYSWEDEEGYFLCWQHLLSSNNKFKRRLK